MKKPLTVLSFFLLSGCVSTQGDVQDYLVTNADLPAKQKINHLKENVPSDGYDASGPCNTLLECAVYTKDIELAEWLFTRWEEEMLMHMIVRERTYYDGEYYKIRYTINSPMRFGLSDDDTEKFIRLMKQHRIDSDVCGYGNYSPITIAYINNYPKTFALLLADHKITPKGKADLASPTSCKFPIEALEKQNVESWQYDSGLLEMAMNHYDGSPEKSKMFAALLDNGNDVERVTDFRMTRCYKYAGSSALAYSVCQNNEKAYNFLLNYYKQTDRLSSAQKEQIFAHAQDVIKNTPSAAELQRKSEEAKLASENAWRKHEAQRAAEWDKFKSEARRNSQKRATTQANDEPFEFDIHSNSSSNSNSSGSAFHLYAEEFPEYKPYVPPEKSSQSTDLYKPLQPPWFKTEY